MKFDAVMVLGKELKRDPERARRELAARSAAASILLRQGAQWVATLEARLKGQAESGSVIVARNLEALGVPRDRIVTGDFTRSTREEALAAARLIRERPVARLAVVTAAYHVARAEWYFTQTLPADRFELITPEQLLEAATPQERLWILEGIPRGRALEEEQRLERVLTGLAAVVSRMPGGWRLEMLAADLLRRAG